MPATAGFLPPGHGRVPWTVIPLSYLSGVLVMPATHVVLGAGPVGRAVVTALLARGIEASFRDAAHLLLSNAAAAA